MGRQRRSLQYLGSTEFTAFVRARLHSIDATLPAPSSWRLQQEAARCEAWPCLKWPMKWRLIKFAGGACACLLLAQGTMCGGNCISNESPPSPLPALQAALPWARPQLQVGSALELRQEPGSGWLHFEVSEVHGDEHQYTLQHTDDDYEVARLGLLPDEEAAAAGDSSGGGTEAAEAEVVVCQVRIRLLSDSALEVLDSDGSSSQPADIWQWRQAAGSLEQLLERGLLQMAERGPLPAGVELPTAADAAAAAADKLREVITRATQQAHEAGTLTITLDMVNAVMAQMAHEMGQPPPPLPPARHP